MSVEEELKKDHSDMQAVVDSKQKIIDAQVSLLFGNTPTDRKISYCEAATFCLCARFKSVCAVTCVLCLRKQRVTETQRHV